jgi:2-keto-4-pentenoate hydratase/2-oxohepta-3-ene-1,7-dioic acid hydratase in catechol pathway
MRLVSFLRRGLEWAGPRTGALIGDRTLDLQHATTLRLVDADRLTESAARRLAEALAPADMTDLVAGGRITMDAIRATHDWATADSARAAPALLGEDDLSPLPVLPKPPLIRDFMAFEQHLENIFPRLGREIPPEWYNIPVYYKGNPSAVGAHGDDVAIPSDCEEMDFEFELAAVIGRGGCDIPREDAMAHIFGFTVYNDLSARDLQQREMSVGLGPAKGKDFTRAHVLGPCLVTIDEIGDIYSKSAEAFVNGKTWCTGQVADMHWRFEDMIAHASRHERLVPGEIFGTGTFGGGSAMERGESLSAGDTIDLTIEGIGTLHTRLVAAT